MDIADEIVIGGLACLNHKSLIISKTVSIKETAKQFDWTSGWNGKPVGCR